ncbi:MAG: lipopolysaccharide assembly protein LapA domain-containing protein [Pseudomonadota bacterium]
MTKRIIAVLILLPVAIIIVALSLANRRPVDLIVPNFDGSALLATQVPLFALLFVVLLLGMVIGSLGTWVRQAKHRRAARENKVEATKAGFEAEKQRERAEATVTSNGIVAVNDRAAALGLPAPTPRGKAA